MSSVIPLSTYENCDKIQARNTCRRQSLSLSSYIASKSDNSANILLKKIIPPLKILVENFLSTFESSYLEYASHVLSDSDTDINQSQGFSKITADCASQVYSVKPLNETNFVKCVNTITKDLNPNESPVDQPTSCVTPYSDLIRIKNMKYEVNRLETFKNKWPLSFISPNDLAAVGFFYMQTADKVQCAFCHGIVVDWSPGDDPVSEHVRHFPLCAFLLNRDVGNIPISGTKYSQKWLIKDSFSENFVPVECSNNHSLNSSVLYSKFPSKANLEKRLETFSRWKHSHIVSSDVLAEAGFYYTGVSDRTVCFHCGGQLGNWEVGDDPWIEHGKHFPKCTFLKAQQRNKNSELSNRDLLTTLKASKEDVNELMMSKLAVEASEIFAEGFVKEALQRQFNRNGRSFENLDDLCSAVLEIYDESKRSSEVPAVSKKEIGNMPLTSDRHLCKICLDQEMGVVFLPCSHMVACLTCAQSVDVCPLCRSPIENFIRAFMS